MNGRCDTCAFFVLTRDVAGSYRAGECRRGAPVPYGLVEQEVPVGASRLTGIWPRVEYHHGCGEYRDIPTTRRNS